MGASTKGIMSSEVTPESVMARLKVFCSNVTKKYDKYDDGSFACWINFEYDAVKYQLFITQSDDCFEIDEDLHTVVSLDNVYDSVEIIKLLLKGFGGYIRENDHDYKGEYKFINKA